MINVRMCRGGGKDKRERERERERGRATKLSASLEQSYNWYRVHLKSSYMFHGNLIMYTICTS